MLHRNLRGSPMATSVLCLGCMNLREREQSYKLLDVAYQEGINFFDTADVYGDSGSSEAMLGSWVRNRKLRARVFLATKVGFRLLPEGELISRSAIIEAAEGSLKRLGMDCIDLYQIHVENKVLPEEEVLAAFEDLKQKGKILLYGASNYTACRLARSSWIANAQSLAGYSCFQGQYNLLERSLEREHIPFLCQEKIGLIAWSPLAKGFLAGKYELTKMPAQSDPSREIWARYNTPANWRVVDVLLELAEELAIHPAVLALAWLLARPAVCAVVFGASSPMQVKTNCAAGGLMLSPDIWKPLDEAATFMPGYPYEGINRFNKKL